MSLFSFQGKVLLGKRLPTGKPANLTWVGNAPICNLSFSTETTTHKESFSGKRLPYGRLQTGIEAGINLVLEELLPVNLIQALYARQVDTAAGTITDEVLPDQLANGDVVKLDNSFLDGVVTITDDAGTNVPEDNIKLSSKSAGLLDVIDVGTFQQPFKASYAHLARSTFAIFGQTPDEVYLILDGINTETNEPVLMRAYRVKFDPAESLDLINEEYGQLSLNGSLLLDNLNMGDEDSEYAGFADIQLKSE